MGWAWEHAGRLWLMRVTKPTLASPLSAVTPRTGLQAELPALGLHTCSENRPPWVRAGPSQTDARMSHSNKPLQSTNEALLRILSSEKAMRIAVAEPAPPIMATPIASTTRCANASDLPLPQNTHSGRSEGISTKSPVGTSPVAHGMTPGP